MGPLFRSMKKVLSSSSKAHDDLMPVNHHDFFSVFTEIHSDTLEFLKVLPHDNHNIGRASFKDLADNIYTRYEAFCKEELTNENVSFMLYTLAEQHFRVRFAFNHVAGRPLKNLYGPANPLPAPKKIRSREVLTLRAIAPLCFREMSRNGGLLYIADEWADDPLISGVARMAVRMYRDETRSEFLQIMKSFSK